MEEVGWDWVFVHQPDHLGGTRGGFLTRPGCGALGPYTADLKSSLVCVLWGRGRGLEEALCNPWLQLR